MRSAVLLVAALALSPARAGHAQSPAQSDAARHVSVAAVPGSFQVVRIPVPDTLASRGDVTVSISAGRGFVVLGDTARTVRAGSAELLLTLSVPAGAHAGPAPAAVARFRAAGGASADVFVDAEVARRRRMTINVSDRRVGVFRGDPLAFTYRVTNAGNAEDTVQVRLVLPQGWRGSAQEDVALAPGASVEHTLRALVSPGSATGSSLVRLLAVSGRDTVGDANATIEVGDPDRRPRNAGARVTLASAAAGTMAGTSGTAQTIAIDGPLTDHLRINARAVVLPRSGGGAAQPFALTRMGYSQMTPSMMLTADAWRLQLGTANLTLPDLSGYAVTGTGASFERDDGRWRMASIFVRPEGSAGGAQGEFLAGSVGTRVAHDGMLTMSASHLADERFESSRLDAFGTELRVPVGFGTMFVSELAHRQFGGGTGMGWRTQLQRQGPTGTFFVRMASAPGGTAAFARAKQDFSAQASQFIGANFSVAGNVWRTRDSSMNWRNLATDGWSLRPSLRVGRALNLSLEGRRSSFSANGTTGVMATDESSLGLIADLRAGPVYSSGSITSASVRREAAANDVRMDNTVGRATGHGAVGLTGAFGRVELNVTGDRAGSGAGLPVRQVAYGVELADVRLIPRSRLLTARVEAQRFDWFGDRPGLNTMRGTLDVNLPRSVRVSLQAERNPFLSFLTPGSNWLFGLAIQTAMSLPLRRAAGDAGIVFRDANANGVQDEGELGIGGILVRRQGETAVTSAEGRFEFSGLSQLPIDVDTRSLPEGLVSPPTAARSQNRQIGLIFVATAQVSLALSEEDASRIPSDELAKVSVVARDERGRAWVAHATVADTRLFDALPPGRYTLEIDASRAAEPLRASGELPTVQVVDGKNPAPSTIVLRARSLKVRQMPKGSP